MKSTRPTKLKAPSSSTILHIDINSYFATMLQQKYPNLRGKPVGVIKDHGRTCIIAASKEAKALGIKTGDNTASAKNLVPHLILIPAEFDFYLDSTRRLKTLFESLSPHVEIFSLDEAFVDITHCRRYLYPQVSSLARHIQTQIKQTLGSWVTCNIGVSHNRFLAKLTSEINPKGSISFATHQNQDFLLSSASFRDICGIGFCLEKKLLNLNLTNLYALNFVSDQFLHRHFGPFWSVQLRRMSQGKEPHLFSLIDKNPHAKSVGRSITGFRPIDNEFQIKSILYNLTTEVIHKARKMNLAGRQVHISLVGSQTGQNYSWHRHLTFKHYISHPQDMFHFIYHQLYRHWSRNFPIIKFGVSLSLLQPVTQIPLSLLPQWQKQEKLNQALDQISAKFGLFTVHSSLLANRQIIKPEVTGFLGDKKYHFL